MTEDTPEDGALKSLSDSEMTKLTALSSVSKALNTSYELDIILWSVLEQLMTAMGAERGFIQLSSRAGRERVALDRSTDPWRRDFVYSQTLIDQCLEGPTPILMLDAAEVQGSDSVMVTGIRSVIIQPLLSEGQLMGVVYLDNLMEVGRFKENDLKLLGIIGEMVSLAISRARDSELLDENRERIREIKEELDSAHSGFTPATREAMERMAWACEFRDDPHGNHIRRIRDYCELVARELGLDEDFANELGYASQLHDLGMVSVPDSIVSKAGPFSDEEREIMQRHPKVGAKLLEDCQSVPLQLAQSIARSHHERWDGTGYPDGLQGEDIPIAARIVAVADTFDSIRQRPHRKNRTLKEAFKTIEEGAGTQFDPRIVDAFLKLRIKVIGVWSKYPDAIED